MLSNYANPSEPVNIQKCIQDAYNLNNFDFREYVYTDDELAYLFDEWVDYYRMKYAICHAIQPSTILEVGVRYGYSAITFLAASPNASYLGIDNDSDTFGGSPGALAWAKKITGEYKADFLLGDTQQMSSFPGEEYDLIHIDGQQDGDGTFHDLELALEKGRYILVDGYFWSNENMQASTFFLKKYDKFIEFAVIIPDYAGELLIKTKDSARDLYSAGKKGNYQEIREHYDTFYYMKDCGGYDIFSKTNGAQLDERLGAIFNLIDPQPGDRILDLGFGRGELAFALAKAGASIMAIDYSSSAVEIARQTYSEHLNNLSLEYIQRDVCNMRDIGKYTKIVAADIVEHIENDALGKMFKTASESLDKDGYMVIHTAHNLLKYKYSYNRRRKAASKLGLWLPANPRTYYEDLMHINEQTPAKLNRLLKKYFRCVITWVGEPNNIAENLDKPPSKNELMEASSIFAVASNSVLSRCDIIAIMSQNKLDIKSLDVELQCGFSGFEAEPGSRLHVPVIISNMGSRMASFLPYPVYLAYHIKKTDNSMITFDGERTPLDTPLCTGQSKEISMNIKAPGDEGEYIVELSMVQEQCFWFEEVLPKFPVNLHLTVRRRIR